MNEGNNLNMTSLKPTELAKILSNLLSKNVAVTHIKKDIEEGAPINDDGSLNLIHYTAWLLTR